MGMGKLAIPAVKQIIQAGMGIEGHGSDEKRQKTITGT